MLALCPSLAHAHQPRLVTGGMVDITNPKVSQAFYGELRAAPTAFRIKQIGIFGSMSGSWCRTFPGVHKDISAEITRITPSGNQQVALLDGLEFECPPFLRQRPRTIISGGRNSKLTIR
jgi:hypothetical protein